MPCRKTYLAPIVPPGPGYYPTYPYPVVPPGPGLPSPQLYYKFQTYSGTTPEYFGLFPLQGTAGVVGLVPGKLSNCIGDMLDPANWSASLESTIAIPEFFNSSFTMRFWVRFDIPRDAFSNAVISIQTPLFRCSVAVQDVGAGPTLAGGVLMRTVSSAESVMPTPGPGFIDGSQWHRFVFQLDYPNKTMSVKVDDAAAYTHVMSDVTVPYNSSPTVYGPLLMIDLTTNMSPDGEGGTGLSCAPAAIYFDELALWSSLLSASDLTLDWNSGVGITTIGPDSPASLAVSPSSLADGTDSTPVSQTFTASGGVGPYTFDALPSTAGQLPPGIAVGTDGVCTGTFAGTGTFCFSVRATDALGTVGMREYTWTVN
jgi:hypothetical protein